MENFKPSMIQKSILIFGFKGVLSILLIFNFSQLKAQFQVQDWYAFEYVQNGFMNVNLNGTLFEMAGGLKVNGNNYIFWQKSSKDNSIYVFFNGLKLGPYNKVGKHIILTESGKYMFMYIKEGSDLIYINVNGKTYGGYENILWNKHKTEFDCAGMTDNGMWYFAYKTKKDDQWRINVNGTKTYPLFYDKENSLYFSRLLSDDSGNIIFSGRAKNPGSNTDSKVVYINGEVRLGEIIDNNLNYTREDNRQYHVTGNFKLADANHRHIEKYYKFFNGEIYGPFSEKPQELPYKWYNKKGEFFFSYIQDMKRYFNICGKEYGPYLADEGNDYYYKSIFFSEKNYLYATKDLNGKYIINHNGYILGPYDNVRATYLDRKGNYSYVTYKDGIWSIHNIIGSQNYETVLKYISESICDSKGNMLCSFYIEGDHIVSYMPSQDNNKTFGPYDDYISDMKLANGNFLFIVGRSKINVNGHLSSLPCSFSKASNISTNILEDGTYGVTYSNEDNRSHFLLNGQQTVSGDNIYRAYIALNRRYLIRYTDKNNIYIIVNGTKYFQGEKDYQMNFFAGPEWHEV